MYRLLHRSLGVCNKAVSLYLILVIGLFVVLSSFVSLALAQPALTINYQGKLTTPANVAVTNGSYTMTFRLYTQATGGTAIWTETRSVGNAVTVTNGLFSVMLGSVTPLTSVNFNQPLYLGVTVESDNEMTPRKLLGSVPSAFEAQRLGGVASSSFIRNDQAGTASGLLTFTGGLISSASSTIQNLTTLTATTTNLVINGQRFSNLLGTGLTNNSGVLTVATSTLGLSAAFTNSSQLAALLSDETGGGAVVFANSPTLVAPNLGTPTALTLTNATGLPIVGGTTGTLTVARGGTGATDAVGARINLGLGTLATLGTVTEAEITNGTILAADLNLTDITLADFVNDTGFVSSTAGNWTGTLDGIDGTQFLRSDASQVYSGGILTVENTAGIDTATSLGSINGLQIFQSAADADALITFHTGSDFAFHFGLDGGINDLVVGGWSMGANNFRVWHQGNDGAGSGLDADLLDGLSATSFSSSFTNSAQLAALLSDETGTGSVVFNASPTFTGTFSAAAANFSSNLSFTGTDANIVLGSNWLSGDGGDEGLFVGASGLTEVFQAATLGDSAGNSVRVFSTRTTGGSGGNNVFRNEWRLRDGAGNDWVTQRIHDGISIDASFSTPGVDTRTWWERDPLDDIQSWGTAASTYMTIVGGNVGIGTTAPSARLQVAGGDILLENSRAMRQFDHTGIARDIFRTMSDGSVLYSGYQGSSLITAVAGATYLFSSGGNQTTMTLFGPNVGIGDTTPTALLTVGNGDLFTVDGSGRIRTNAANSNSVYALDIISSGNLANNRIARIGISGATNGFTIEQTATSELRYAFEAGNVGIGTASPSQRLSVQQGNILISSSDQSLARLQLENTAVAGRRFDLVSGIPNIGQAGFAIFDATANESRLVVSDVGNVGIGDVTPSALLTVGNGDLFIVTSSGDVGATSFTATGGVSGQNLVNRSFDFILGTGDQVTRGDSGASRALVKGGGNVLNVNFAGDFTGGTLIGNSLFVSNSGGLSGVTGLTSSGDITISNDNNAVLTLGRQNNVGEGGEIRFLGSAGNDSWVQDVVGQQMRIFTTSNNTNLLAVSNVGAGVVNFSVDGTGAFGTSPTAARLTLANNVASNWLDNYSEYQLMLFDGGSAAGSYGLGIKDSTIVFNSGGGAYSFDRGGGAATMVLDSDGDVGIGGGPNPDSRLQVIAPGAVAGMRIGFLNNSENYFDADNQYFRTQSGSPLMIVNATGLGVGGVAREKLDVRDGDILVDGNPGADNGNIFIAGGNRYGGADARNSDRISVTAGLTGRVVNRNTDFLDGLTGYGVYNNVGGNKVTHSLVSTPAAPNSSGQALRISYDGTGSPNSDPTPGYGGFFIAIDDCSGTNSGVNGFCYRQGGRYHVKVWANIPVGRNIQFASNAYGDGGNVKWISSRQGTGTWQLYELIQTIGIGGSLNTTGFWFIDSDSSNSAFTWNVARVEMTALDEAASVQLASTLNVGYQQNANLNFGEALTTGSAYFATTNGNVGIGTQTPDAKLEVFGSTAVSINTNFNDTSRFKVETGAGYSTIGTITNDVFVLVTNNSERMRINETGNVGIGTTNPDSRLQVIAPGAAAGMRIGFFGNSENYFDADNQYFRTQSGSTLMALSAAGLGLGTSNPGARLDIFGSEAADEARIAFSASDDSNRFIIETDLEGSISNDLLSFRSAATDNILALRGDGTVGIGTTSNLNANARFRVLQTSGPQVAEFYAAGSESRIIIANDNNVSGIREAGGLNLMYNNGGALVDGLRLDHSGRVGIGDVTPDKFFDVEGSAVFGSGGYASGAVVDIGSNTVDYPGNSGWAATFNTNLALHGLDSTSIGFHDSNTSIGVLSYTNNTFALDGSDSWGPVRLGINDRTPDFTLDVSGTGRFTGDLNARDVYAIRGDAPNTGVIYLGANSGTRYLYYDGSQYIMPGANLLVNGALTWTAGNDGAGSGLDADLLDGITSTNLFNNMGLPHGSYTDFNSVPDFGSRFIQGTTNGPGTGSTQFYSLNLGLGTPFSFDSYAIQIAIPRDISGDRYLSIRNRELGTWGAWNKISAGYADSAGVASSLGSISSASLAGSVTDETGTGVLVFNTNPSFSGTLTVNGSGVWHAGNDGAGSGLDADLIDGFQASQIVKNQDGSRFTTNLNSLLSSGFYNAEGTPANAPGSFGQLITARGADTALQIYGGYNNDLYYRGWGYGPEADGFYAWRRLWDNVNDGAGSGLDADLLDGLSASSFSSAFSNSLGLAGLLSDETGTGAVVFNTNPSFNGQVTLGGRLMQSASGIGVANRDDISTRIDSGFFQTDTPTVAEGWPVDSSWYNLITNTHGNDGNYYSMQFAGSFFSSNELFYRATNNSGTTAWNRMWHQGNDGAGSGLDADLLDGLSAASFSSVFSTSAGLASLISDETGTGAAVFANDPVFGNMSGGTITNRGFDFILGSGDQVSRGDSGASRALVKNSGNRLSLNFVGDFTGGTTIGNSFAVSNAGAVSGVTTLTASGDVTIGGDLSDRRLEVATAGDGITFGQTIDNTHTIQTYIDGQWANRTTYASGCCNGLLLQPDVGYVQIGSGLTIQHNGTMTGVGSINGQTISGAASFTGSLTTAGDIVAGGYVYGTYFNSSAGNNENPTIGQIWTQNTTDNFLRKSTPAHFIAQLGLLTASNFNSFAPTLGGGGASGTWGINVTGSAGSVPWSGVSGRPANIFYYQGFTLDANTMDPNASGFTYAVNAPFVGPIASFGEVSYPLQITATYSGGGEGLAFRTRNGDIATWNGWNTILHSDNFNSYSPTLTGGGASGTWGINITGNANSATTLSTNRSNWSSNGTISATVGELAWKHYGNGHVIFDASNGTSPNGTAINNTNPDFGWSSTFPTLMGWNGANTYGVRVDSARLSDTANALAAISSASLAGSITDETGTGALVFNNNPTFGAINTGQILAGGRISAQAGQPESGVIGTAAGSLGGLEVLSSGSAGTAGAAFLTFHRPGAYATYFGIDTDNRLKVGGWSMGAQSFPIWHDGVGGGSIDTANFRSKLNSVTGSGALVFNNTPTIDGNLNFSSANPTISASSYFIAPGGAYFSSGPVYTEASINARGGIGNDTSSVLTVWGGTSGITNFNGNVGMGISNPSNRLSVSGNVSFNGALGFNRNPDNGAVPNGGSGANARFQFTNFGTYMGWDSFNTAGNQTGGIAIAGATGNVGIALLDPVTRLDVNGEITSRSSNAFRMVNGNFGSFFRNDGSDTYLLLTNSGDQFGNWNSLRPFAVNNTTGQTRMDNGVIVGSGQLQVCNGGACASSGPAGSVTAEAAITSEEFNLSTAGSITVNWDNGNQQRVSGSTGNMTFTFSGATAGQTMRLVVCYGGTHTVTWGSTIRWGGGTAPTPTSTAGRCDVFSFLYTGTEFMGQPSLNF